MRVGEIWKRSSGEVIVVLKRIGNEFTMLTLWTDNDGLAFFRAGSTVIWSVDMSNWRRIL